MEAEWPDGHQAMIADVTVGEWRQRQSKQKSTALWKGMHPKTKEELVVVKHKCRPRELMKLLVKGAGAPKYAQKCQASVDQHGEDYAKELMIEVAKAYMEDKFDKDGFLAHRDLLCPPEVHKKPSKKRGFAANSKPAPSTQPAAVQCSQNDDAETWSSPATDMDEDIFQYVTTCLDSKF